MAMIFTYRVTTDRKGDPFMRVYHIPSTYTLYDTRRFIEGDLDFDDSQPAFFAVLDAAGKKKAKYALFDMGFGAMDTVTLDNLKNDKEMIYVFDLFNNRFVRMEFLGETEALPRKHYPLVAESVGEAPGQFEDKPLPEKLPALAASSDEDEEDENNEEEEEDDKYDDNDLSMLGETDQV